MNERPQVKCQVCGEVGVVSRGFYCWCLRRKRVQETILKRTRIDPESGCWIWNGKLTDKGYPSFKVKTPFGIFLRHRGSFVVFNGTIPTGMVVDHECRSRACLNPAHLRPMTALNNTMIGASPPAINRRKTHCWRGHPFIEANVYLRGGSRHCRTCALLDAGMKFEPFQNGEFVVYKNQGPNLGEDHPAAILTEAIVLQMRAKYRRGVYGMYRLAKEFHTTKSNVLHVLQRKTWTHI